MRPEGWGRPDPDRRPAWEDWRLQVLLAVLVLFVLVGVVASTPVRPWYYAR
jgi:hypothetical protein